MAGAGYAVTTTKRLSYIWIYDVFCICAEANVGEGLADSDLLVGQLLKLSTMQCPSLAKTWFTLANWCYKWGRKAVDNAAYV